MNSFAEILESIEQMPFDERIALNDIITKRVSESKREALIKTVISSRNDYKNGKAKKTSVENIINKITS